MLQFTTLKPFSKSTHFEGELISSKIQVPFLPEKINQNCIFSKNPPYFPSPLIREVLTCVFI